MPSNYGSQSRSLQWSTKILESHRIVDKDRTNIKHRFHTFRVRYFLKKQTKIVFDKSFVSDKQIWKEYKPFERVNPCLTTDKGRKMGCVCVAGDRHTGHWRQRLAQREQATAWPQGQKTAEISSSMQIRHRSASCSRWSCSRVACKRYGHQYNKKLQQGRIELGIQMLLCKKHLSKTLRH